MNFDSGFIMMMVSIGIFGLSPIWLPMTLFFLWRQSILSRFKFVAISTLVLFCALFIAIGGANLLANAGVNFFALSGNLCKLPVFLCRAFDLFYPNRGVVGFFVYLLFAIVFVVTMWLRTPHWLGFDPMRVRR